jgi:hypothetical protein
MIILFFISLAVFTLGLTAIVLKYGVPESVSESYYLLPEKVRLPVFYGWTATVALPLLISWIDISKDKGIALIFFGCAFLIFVGAAAPFKDKGMTGNVHAVSALLCAVLTQIWIFAFTPFWVFSPAFAALFASFGLKIKGAKGGGRESARSLIFFLELAAFLSAYIAVYGCYKL